MTLDKVVWQMIVDQRTNGKEKMLRINDSLDLQPYRIPKHHTEEDGEKMAEKEIQLDGYFDREDPFNAIQKYRKCKKDMEFNHKQGYVSIEKWNLILRIKEITLLEDSLTKLIRTKTPTYYLPTSRLTAGST